MNANSNTAALARMVNVHKVFPDAAREAVVLGDISFDIFPGEMLLLLGPSGSGKSTFLTVLAGLQPPSSGMVQLFGRDVGSYPPAELQRLRAERIGFIFQTFHLIGALTALENVLMVMRFIRMQRQQARRRAMTLLDQLGIVHLANAYPATMSQGEKQRVAIARALANNAPLLIADEPTGSLSGEQGMQIIRLLRQEVDMHQRGAIIASHDPRVAEFADKVFHLQDGVIQLVESPPSR
jgi:putative ABC transport system ATP-binding protein